MSDQIIKGLRKAIEFLIDDGYDDNENPLRVIKQAADRLESLTRAKEVAEGDVEFRCAFAFDGIHHSVYAERTTSSDKNEQLMEWALGDLSHLVTHQAYFTVNIPAVKIPTIQAEAVEVPNAETR